mmetsp:Transcript_298/g.442  ORF Transcript_298/g.442 Transcript_298/m.442 type:complete len:143 (-) Transcript_298:69-497(-)
MAAQLAWLGLPPTSLNHRLMRWLTLAILGIAYAPVTHAEGHALSAGERLSAKMGYGPVQGSLDDQAQALAAYAKEIAEHQRAVGNEIQQAMMVDQRNRDIITRHKAYLSNLRRQYDSVKSSALSVVLTFISNLFHCNIFTRT